MSRKIGTEWRIFRGGQVPRLRRWMVGKSLQIASSDQPDIGRRRSSALHDSAVHLPFLMRAFAHHPGPAIRVPTAHHFRQVLESANAAPPHLHPASPEFALYQISPTILSDPHQIALNSPHPANSHTSQTQPAQLHWICSLLPPHLPPSLHALKASPARCPTSSPSQSSSSSSVRR
jgi:hypothetical protein